MKAMHCSDAPVHGGAVAERRLAVRSPGGLTRIRELSPDATAGPDFHLHIRSQGGRDSKTDFHIVGFDTRPDVSEKLRLLSSAGDPARMEIVDSSSEVPSALRRLLLKNAAQHFRVAPRATAKGWHQDIDILLPPSGDGRRRALAAIADTMAELAGAVSERAPQTLRDAVSCDDPKTAVLDVTRPDWRDGLEEWMGLPAGPGGSDAMEPARGGALDSVAQVLEATRDLRSDRGRLSAAAIAEVFGLSLSELARMLDRTKQALSKTPDAESLQTELEYFERIARLRAVTSGDGEFRKWLRTPNPTLGRRKPLDLIERGQWQALADKVDDMLTGAPV